MLRSRVLNMYTVAVDPSISANSQGGRVVQLADEKITCVQWTFPERERERGRERERETLF